MNKFTITDYNQEKCTFDQLTNKQQLLIVYTDILMILENEKYYILLTETEFDIVRTNKECFNDIVSFESDVYSNFDECTMYKFKVIK